MCIAFAALFAANASAAEVARFVEYVQTDGNTTTPGEYVILDYTPTATSVVEVDFAILDATKNHTVFCSRSAGSSRTFTCFYIANTGFRWDYNTTQNNTGKKLASAGERHTVRCAGTGFYFDGNLVKSVTPANFIPGNRMTLFASYNNQTAPTTPTPDNNFAKMKLYSFKAWDDDGAALKVDLYPCVDTDGIAALYDGVTGKLYYNRKSGTSFTASPTTVPPPPSFVIMDVAVAQTNGAWYATVALENGSGAVDLQVVSPQGATNVVALSNGVATAPATFTTAIPGLAADTFYSVFASLASGTSTNFTGVANIFNGPVSVEATANATPTTPGVFTVSRPAADGATSMPLTVAFTLSGTAVAGTHYLPIPETVTIPAGAAAATVEVATLAQVTAATSLTLSLACDNHLPGNTASATMAVNSAFFTGDWFVAKDGDDANSGASRAEAKATIPAAYACLTNIPAARVGNRLVICDGEWTSTDFGSTLVLSNGWSVVGEHGRGATTLKALSAGFRFFTLASADSEIRGLTLDFNRVSVTYQTSAVENPYGTIADCELRDYYSTWIGNGAVGMIRVGQTASTANITNCVFRRCANKYNGPSTIRVSTSAKVNIIGCEFVDCVSGDSGNSGGGTVFAYCGRALVRNCLFLRSVVYGAKSAYNNYAGVVNCNAYGSNMTVENCTFADCRVVRRTDVGVVQAGDKNSRLTVRNCLAYGNVNDAGPVGFVTNFVPTAYANCASEFELAGADNVVLTDSDFRFANAANGDYRVKRGPSVNAGLNLDWMAGATDLAGKPRIMDRLVDIGCYESDRPRPTQILVR
ncbi:MAG: right-handed parallel beta-helix repeat-containing protein [Kiritimatiellae bacterium]|nr:right-handed parallel beta-helix repeat-containing protein [Kiritimatiellia bacterium]